MLEFPDISPIAIQLGPLAIRWYSLAYILGIGGGVLLHKRTFKQIFAMTGSDQLDILTALMAGILLGGRLGYALFYNASFYLEHPEKILAIWNGGMSFHGGAIGAMVAMIWISKKHNITPWVFLDLLAVSAPIGLFLGRLANFINGELYGRVTSQPWGIVFPGGGPLPRHPSQLYEAGLEGVCLFIVLYVLHRRGKMTSGIIFGLFILCYAIIRFAIEFFREPDAHLGLLWLNLSMGQWLSLLMAAIGIAVITYRLNKPLRA